MPPFSRSSISSALLSFSVLLFLVSLMPRPSQAGAITNGGFETTDFSGWSAIGLTSIESAAFGVGPAEGTHQALMVVDDEHAALVGEIETFLGLPAGGLGSATGLLGTEGAAIKQTIALDSGERLLFDWNFLTNEISPNLTFNDFAFWTLLGVQEGEVLADTFSPALHVSESPFSRESGYATHSFLAPDTGSYVLGFGVMDEHDEVVNSGLLIDSVRVVPEPGVPALIGLGLGLLGGSRGRRSARLMQFSTD